MDRNKLKVLRDLGYKVLPTCGLCRHSSFPQNEWGTCSANKYQHLKHTGEMRDLSIHKSGTCPKFHADLALLEKLGGFYELV